MASGTETVPVILKEATIYAFRSSDEFRPLVTAGTVMPVTAELSIRTNAVSDSVTATTISRVFLSGPRRRTICILGPVSASPHDTAD